MNQNETFSTDESFSQLSLEFPSKEDQEIIQERKKSYSEASELAVLLEGTAGQKLIEWLDKEITRVLLLLIATREDSYISDVKSLLEIKSKLINAGSIKSSIETWLHAPQNYES
jgi:hypothetical protein